MKCYTALGGAVTAGIRLHKGTTPDGGAGYFVHVNPDHYGHVKSVDDLLRFGCAHFEGDDIVVDRCIVADGDLKPEMVPDGKALVLGAIDHRLAEFGSHAAPEGYRTAIGPNLCFHPLVTRHVNRVMGRTTGHEQYAFLGIFEEGDCLKANIIFEDASNKPIDLWADGELLAFRGGELRFQAAPVGLKSTRWLQSA
jgi:hypothetical protein